MFSLDNEILGVVRERYEDFAPTLAWEKLTEVHGYAPLGSIRQ